MALRQAVVALLEITPSLKVLWRRDAGARVIPDDLAAIPRGEAQWLVVSDSADLVAKQLHRTVQMLSGVGRSDVYEIKRIDSDYFAED
jgi:hypothetical protein